MFFFNLQCDSHFVQNKVQHKVWRNPPLKYLSTQKKNFEVFFAITVDIIRYIVHTRPAKMCDSDKIETNQEPLNFQKKWIFYEPWSNSVFLPTAPTRTPRVIKNLLGRPRTRETQILQGIRPN